MPIARERRRKQQANRVQRDASMKAVQAKWDFAPRDRNRQRGGGQRKKQLMKEDLPPVKADMERLKNWKGHHEAEIAPLRHSPRQRLSPRRGVEGNCRSRSRC